MSFSISYKDSIFRSRIASECFTTDSNDFSLYIYSQSGIYHPTTVSPSRLYFSGLSFSDTPTEVFWLHVRMDSTNEDARKYIALVHGQDYDDFSDVTIAFPVIAETDSSGYIYTDCCYFSREALEQNLVCYDRNEKKAFKAYFTSDYEIKLFRKVWLPAESRYHATNQEIYNNVDGESEVRFYFPVPSENTMNYSPTTDATIIGEDEIWVYNYDQALDNCYYVLEGDGIDEYCYGTFCKAGQSSKLFNITQNEIRDIYEQYKDRDIEYHISGSWTYCEKESRLKIFDDNIGIKNFCCPNTYAYFTIDGYSGAHPCTYLRLDCESAVWIDEILPVGSKTITMRWRPANDSIENYTSKGINALFFPTTSWAASNPYDEDHYLTRVFDIQQYDSNTTCFEETLFSTGNIKGNFPAPGNTIYNSIGYTNSTLTSTSDCGIQIKIKTSSYISSDVGLTKNVPISMPGNNYYDGVYQIQVYAFNDKDTAQTATLQLTGVSVEIPGNSWGLVDTLTHADSDIELLVTFDEKSNLDNNYYIANRTVNASEVFANSGYTTFWTMKEDASYTIFQLTGDGTFVGEYWKPNERITAEGFKSGDLGNVGVLLSVNPNLDGAAWTYVRDTLHAGRPFDVYGSKFPLGSICAPAGYNDDDSRMEFFYNYYNIYVAKCANYNPVGGIQTVQDLIGNIYNICVPCWKMINKCDSGATVKVFDWTVPSGDEGYNMPAGYATTIYVKNNLDKKITVYLNGTTLGYLDAGASAIQPLAAQSITSVHTVTYGEYLEPKAVAYCGNYYDGNYEKKNMKNTAVAGDYYLLASLNGDDDYGQADGAFFDSGRIEPIPFKTDEVINGDYGYWLLYDHSHADEQIEKYFMIPYCNNTTGIASTNTWLWAPMTMIGTSETDTSKPTSNNNALYDVGWFAPNKYSSYNSGFWIKGKKVNNDGYPFLSFCSKINLTLESGVTISGYINSCNAQGTATTFINDKYIYIPCGLSESFTFSNTSGSNYVVCVSWNTTRYTLNNGTSVTVTLDNPEKYTDYEIRILTSSGYEQRIYNGDFYTGDVWSSSVFYNPGQTVMLRFGSIPTDYKILYDIFSDSFNYIKTYGTLEENINKNYDYWIYTISFKQGISENKANVRPIYTSFYSRVERWLIPIVAIGYNETTKKIPDFKYGMWSITKSINTTDYFTKINQDGVWSPGRCFFKSATGVSALDESWVSAPSCQITRTGALSHCDLGIKSCEDLGSAYVEDFMIYFGKRSYPGWLQNTNAYIPAGIKEYVTCTADDGYYIRVTNERTGKVIIVEPGQTGKILVDKNPEIGNVYNFYVEESTTPFDKFTYRIRNPWYEKLSFAKLNTSNISLAIDDEDTIYNNPVVDDQYITFTLNENSTIDTKFILDFNPLSERTESNLNEIVWGKLFTTIESNKSFQHIISMGACLASDDYVLKTPYNMYRTEEHDGLLIPCRVISSISEVAESKENDWKILLYIKMQGLDERQISYNFKKTIFTPAFEVFGDSYKDNDSIRIEFIIQQKASQKLAAVLSYLDSIGLKRKKVVLKQEARTQIETINGSLTGAILKVVSNPNNIYVRIQDEWISGNAYIYKEGNWIMIQPYVYINGEWKATIS